MNEFRLFIMFTVLLFGFVMILLVSSGRLEAIATFILIMLVGFTLFGVRKWQEMKLNAHEDDDLMKEHRKRF